MRFLIMRRYPVFIDDAGTEVELTDRDDGGHLLRILLLAREDGYEEGRSRGASGKPVEKEMIARHMPALRASGATKLGDPITVGAVQGQKSHLTNRIGTGWIQTVGDSYRLDVDALEVDAFAFEHEIDRLGVRQMRDVEDAEPDKIADLRRLKTMWKAHPVEPFDNSEHEDLAFLHHHFQTAYQRLRFALVYALLQRGEHGDLAEAVSLLTAMAQASREDTDDEVWSLLLRAQGSLPGYQRLVQGVLTVIEKCLGEVPTELAELAGAVLDRDADLLFGATDGPAGERAVTVRGGVADSLNAGALEKIAFEVGISADGSSLRLQGSRTDPMDCVEATNRRLYFSGVFATKWVDSKYKRSRLAMLLSRLDNELLKPGRDLDAHGAGSQQTGVLAPARFLILDPEGDSYQRYLELTGSTELPESVPWLKELADEHPSFEVRLFDALPTFRIVIIDDDVVSISPYLLSGYDHEGGQAGWDAAHVALSPFAPWALARSFEALFLEQWRVARPIEELQ